jgi:hypothetical protein
MAKSGPRTYGLDRFWHSCPGRAERGGAISGRGGRECPHNSADCLSVAQTPPRRAADPESTRIATDVAQWRRVVTPDHLQPLPYGRTDGACSKGKCMDGVCALTLDQSGTRRGNATLRSLYTGPERAGPGRPKTDDGQGQWAIMCNASAICAL